jgi:hypothetical protein
MAAPRRPSLLALALVLASGCGGAGVSRQTTPEADPCADLVRARDEARDALARCEGAVPAWRHGALYDAALLELGSIGASPRPVPPAAAQRAADALWALLDAVSPELTDHVALDRAENAAESILRDREGDPSRAAATEAEAALREIQRQLAPAAAPCTDEANQRQNAERSAASCASAQPPR